MPKKSSKKRPAPAKKARAMAKTPMAPARGRALDDREIDRVVGGGSTPTLNRKEYLCTNE